MRKADAMAASWETTSSLPEPRVFSFLLPRGVEAAGDICKCQCRRQVSTLIDPLFYSLPHLLYHLSVLAFPQIHAPIYLLRISHIDHGHHGPLPQILKCVFANMDVLLYNHSRIDFSKFNIHRSFCFCFSEREQRRGRGGGERESQAGSTLSTELRVGLALMT